MTDTLKIPAVGGLPFRVLGIDTSLRSTGVAVIEVRGNRMTFVEGGAIRSGPQVSHSACLLRLDEGVGDLILRTHPDAVAIEGAFFCKNVRTAMVLGEARGVAITACVRHGLPVFEYAPRRVKQAVAGNGAASKEQVRLMVMRLLALTVEPQEDEGDACALAICHSNSRSPHAALAPIPL